ncbi:MAG: 4Fe-4S binding protein [Candidatus Hydrogenedens sp.]|nr:4Fe-4S binding protein [Candidatus Hydrogenedens sp.]
MKLIEAVIEKENYSTAGQASRKIKESLVQIGVDSVIIRKAMVAVYEAEMNVAIHTNGGKLRAAIARDVLEVTVEDEGPGISDIQQAMTAGYSTAPDSAREMGFGAGMGLPNIQRNTDRFSMSSQPGTGTVIRFAISLAAHGADSLMGTSLTTDPSKCIHCLKCVHVCPTQAMRVHRKGPEILTHLCVDCTACMRVCPTDVFDFKADRVLPERKENQIFCLPEALRGQFPLLSTPETLQETLYPITGDKILFSHTPTYWMNGYLRFYQERCGGKGFKIAPLCPSISRLIQLRYPSLLPHMLPLMTPLLSLREKTIDHDLVIVPSCPAEFSQAQGIHALNKVHSVHPTFFQSLLMKRIKKEEQSRPVQTASFKADKDCLVVTGINQVCHFLDQVEHGELQDCGLVVLYACVGGCYGSPVWTTPAAIAEKRSRYYDELEGAQRDLIPLYRVQPLTPRAGARLDSDMKTAMAKLGKINEIVKTFPGNNCGACGSPSCLTHAEDIVLGRTTDYECPFLVFTQTPGQESLPEEFL